MTVLYSNDFESETADVSPSGWLGVFKVRSGNSAINVSGSKAMAAYGEADTSPGKYVGITARTQVSYQIKQKAQFNGSSLLLHGLGHADRSDVSAYDNGYRCMPPVASATSCQLTLDRCVSTIFSNGLQTNSRSWSVAAGDIIVQKLVIDGTSVKYWIWNETNESQPASPIIDYTDSTQRAAGYFFIVYNNGGGAVATGFDDITISDLAAGGGGTSVSITGQAITFAQGAVTASLPSGTVTIPAVKDMTTGVLRTGETGATVIINDATTGALIVKKTAQTTHGTTGVCTVSDVTLTAGTTYRVTLILADGSEGTWKYTAA